MDAKKGVSCTLDSMIVGIGVDLCEVDRIEAAIARHGERFLARIYTEAERAYCESKAEPDGALCGAICRQGSSDEGDRHGMGARGRLARLRGDAGSQRAADDSLPRSGAHALPPSWA